MNGANQPQPQLSGIELLTQVVMPKLIERVKTVEGRMSELEKQIADLLTATAKKPTAKRKTKAEKEAEAAAAKAAAEAEAQADPTTHTASVEPPAPANVAGVAAPTAPVLPAAAPTVVDPQMPAASPSVPPVQTSPQPVVIDNIPITGAVIQGVQYVMQQGYSDGPTIAQALGIPQSAVDYVLALPADAQIAIFQQFPPAPVMEASQG